MKIARHKVLKPKWIRQRIEQEKSLIQVSIANVAEHPDNLYSLINAGVQLADFQAAFRDERPKIRDSLHVTCQAAAAVFRNLKCPGVSLAVRQGIEIEVETDYLPAELLFPSEPRENDPGPMAAKLTPAGTRRK